MTDVLISGRGRCACTAHVLVRPTRTALELGAAPDLIVRTLQALHRVNRTGDADDFLAFSLPGIGDKREHTTPGDTVAISGSPASIDRFLKDEGFSRAIRRGMCQRPIVYDVNPIAGLPGIAVVRDRSFEKRSQGWQDRNRRRAEKRGVTLGPRQPTVHDGSGIVPIAYGDIVLNLRSIEGITSGGVVEVGTYGTSSIGFPAMLPVLPMLEESLAA